jgi:hypothetical protein
MTPSARIDCGDGFSVLRPGKVREKLTDKPDLADKAGRWG